MKLIDQLDNIKKTDNGYEFTLNGVFQLYPDAYLLIYYTYASEYMYEKLHTDDNGLRAFIIDKYAVLKDYTNPTELETDFVQDYTYFITQP